MRQFFMSASLRRGYLASVGGSLAGATPGAFLAGWVLVRLAQIRDLSGLRLVPLGLLGLLLMIVGGAIGCATMLRRLGFDRRGVTAGLFVAAAVVLLVGVISVSARFDEQGAASATVIIGLLPAVAIAALVARSVGVVTRAGGGKAQTGGGWTPPATQGR